MITLWSRSRATRDAGSDGAEKPEEIKTTGWAVGVPLLVAALAAGASVQVARVNRDAGLQLERERRTTALDVERLKEDLLRARPPAPPPATEPR